MDEAIRWLRSLGKDPELRKAMTQLAKVRAQTSLTGTALHALRGGPASVS
jgi:hypothetical protein